MSATNTTNAPNATNTNFDGIHVSKGFVRGLQGQVLKLEQVQQSLIRQLEHANKLASEYYAAAVDWQHKHDTALHEMEKTKQALGHERTQWNSSLNHAVDLYEREKKLRLEREHEMTHLEQLLAEQIEMSTSPSPSPSPAHRPHRINESPRLREPMSPFSIPSSPRKSAVTTATTATTATLSARDHEFIKKQLLIEADTTPFDENDERVVMRDGKRMKQWVQNGFKNTALYGEREMTMSENEEYDEEGGDQDDQSQEYDEGNNDYHRNDAYSQSSQTTDCTGEPIFHSDSD